MREVGLSGPAALPGLSFESCFAAPLTVTRIFGITGKLSFLGRKSFTRWCNLCGTNLVNTDWNWLLRILAFSTGSV